ncbi:MAG: NifB/NifX family molybdenum-iron cluster-binding protein [Desulforegulaceae bacterium]|nr:NifB/NifX family molybdenum-iron cluster-binding protein [Desulforegulaceae bacterium]
MKLAIASNGKDSSALVDERFGRADYFLLTNEEGTSIEEVIDNNAKNSETGAGTGAASLIAEKGVKMLFAGNLGPKAQAVLDEAGISFISFSGTVAEAMEFAKQGNLPPAGPPSSPGTPGSGAGRGTGQGRGLGQGGGMGQGGGGRGRGGRGMGQGRGMGSCGRKGTGRNQSGRL